MITSSGKIEIGEVLSGGELELNTNDGASIEFLSEVDAVEIINHFILVFGLACPQTTRPAISGLGPK